MSTQRYAQGVVTVYSPADAAQLHLCPWKIKISATDSSVTDTNMYVRSLLYTPCSKATAKAGIVTDTNVL